ncbi:MAG TPA: hypothetical protein DDY16_04745 [Tenacibaculum sp.]|nr:hypothetical protein [Tenacibaculum sp.]
MLTYNVDVIDSLTNGAFGEVVGFQFTNSGAVKCVLVHFKNDKVGKNKRKQFSFLQSQFPGVPVTPIEKIEFKFSMSKKQTNNQILTALQFPLKLSFACTAHKMQGATVCKPEPLVLDLTHLREPAQGYVMLSRVQAISQLFIEGDIPKNKIYPSAVAMEELTRLKNVSINKLENMIRMFTFITSLNIRSLPKHIEDLRNDYKMKKCNMICLQETWCSNDFDNTHLNIEGFNLHLTNRGPGKGVANYFKNGFKLTGEVNTDFFQMTKFSSSFCDIINIYRSQGANNSFFIEKLTMLITDCNNCFIVGDFNIDILTIHKHPVIQWLISSQFTPLVNCPTHESGSLLDYAFVKSKLEYGFDLHWPYYSDHAAVCIGEKK